MKICTPLLLAAAGCLTTANVIAADSRGWLPVVDWATLLHGEPAAPPKAPPPAQLARVTTMASVTVDPEVESFLRALAGAIKVRDGAQVADRLSDRFSVEGLADAKRAPALFSQAVDQMAGPAEMIVTGIDRRSGGRVASVEFRYADQPARKKTFAFDDAGRLLATDMFRIRIQPHGG